MSFAVEISAFATPPYRVFYLLGAAPDNISNCVVFAVPVGTPLCLELFLAKRCVCTSISAIWKKSTL